jgi:putative Holliday junction resolvase
MTSRFSDVLRTVCVVAEVELSCVSSLNVPDAAPPPTTDDPLPTGGALLGVDYGTRRIGIAVCNAEQTIAVPLETWTCRSREDDARHFRELVRDYRIRGIVVGLPLMSRSGDESRQAASAREFGAWLQAETGIPVAYWDERYSSSEAETLLWSRGEPPGRKKGRLDGLAAQIILQGYLDSGRLRDAL